MKDKILWTDHHKDRLVENRAANLVHQRLGTDKKWHNIMFWHQDDSVLIRVIQDLLEDKNNLEQELYNAREESNGYKEERFIR